MGQFSRDLMVIAFLGGHIAFHPVQCVRPIYQSSSLSLLGLSRIRVAVGGVDVAKRRRERGREREIERECGCMLLYVSPRGEGDRRFKGRKGERGRERRNGGGSCKERRRDVDRAATGNPSAVEHSSPLGGRALPDCRREVAEVWPRS